MRNQEKKKEVYFRAKYDEDDVFRSGDLDMLQITNNHISVPILGGIRDDFLPFFASLFFYS